VKVKEIGGVELKDLENRLLTEDYSKPTIIRLAPSEMRLTHLMVGVDDIYQLADLERDHLFFVTLGTGQLIVEEWSVDIREGSAFVVLSKVNCRIKAKVKMILHQFEWM
jgi:mannose-6-phosphate isomerase-like protein (cupin superfamily)